MWVYIPNLSMGSASSPESMVSDEALLSRCLDSALSLTWSGKPIQLKSLLKKWKRAPWTRHLCSRMSSPSQQESLLDEFFEQLGAESRSSMEASPARTSPRLARGTVSQVSDPVSGPSLPESFARWDPASSLWRTSRPSSDGDCLPYSKRLPNAGIGMRGELSKLPMLEPLTTASVSSSSLWPTAVANDDNKSLAAHMAMKARMPGGARHTITSLNVMAKAWTERVLWSTIRASDAAKGGPNQSFGAGGTPLPAQAVTVAKKLWKTPHGAGNLDHTGKMEAGGEFAKQANRWMSDFLHTHQDLMSLTTGITSSNPTPSWLPPLSGRLQLNPLFVEWLMGLPIGTTCVCDRRSDTNIETLQQPRETAA